MAQSSERAACSNSPPFTSSTQALAFCQLFSSAFCRDLRFCLLISISGRMDTDRWTGIFPDPRIFSIRATDATALSMCAPPRPLFFLTGFDPAGHCEGGGAILSCWLFLEKQLRTLASAAARFEGYTQLLLPARSLPTRRAAISAWPPRSLWS